jgi:hypothetical protein
MRQTSSAFLVVCHIRYFDARAFMLCLVRLSRSRRE